MKTSGIEQREVQKKPSEPHPLSGLKTIDFTVIYANR